MVQVMNPGGPVSYCDGTELVKVETLSGFFPLKQSSSFQFVHRKERRCPLVFLSLSYVFMNAVCFSYKVEALMG